MAFRKKMKMNTKRTINVQGIIDKEIAKNQFSGKPVNAWEAARRKKKPNMSVYTP